MKKKERERGEGGAGHRDVSFCSKSFPSFFLLFASFSSFFRAPFFGRDFFFLFFCAKNVFRVTKRGVFFSSGVGRGEGFIFFLFFGVKRLFVCILFFFQRKRILFDHHHHHLTSSRACRRRRRIIIIIALFVRGVGEKTLFETL